MHQELQMAFPNLSKNEAYKLSRILNEEGVWKKNLNQLIQPDETNLESIVNNYKMNIAINLLLHHWENKNRILVVSDDQSDSVAANAIITRILRLYGFDVDYIVERTDFVNKEELINSTNKNYNDDGHNLIIAIGSITHVVINTLKGRKKEGRTLTVVIDDAPMPAFDKKYRQALSGNPNYQPKLIKDKVYVYPKCGAYINPYDPENETKNKQMSKAAIAYKIMQEMIQRKNWDTEDLEGSLSLVALGMVASEKKMFHSPTQSYENRYLFEKAKSELNNPNSIWLLALSEITKIPKWEKPFIHKVLTKLTVVDNQTLNETDVIEFLCESRVAEARTTGYALMSQLEKRKDTIIQKSIELQDGYKEDERFKGAVFGQLDYVNEAEYTRLIDANNRNADTLNKVAIVHLKTQIEKSVIIISTPTLVTNEMFLGYLMLKYGKVQRRGRALVLSVKKGHTLQLLKEISRFIENNSEEVFYKEHNYEVEEMTDMVLNVINHTGLDLTLYASKNQLTLVDSKKKDGLKIANIKRNDYVAVLSCWDDVKLESPLCDKEKVDIFYRLDTVSKNKKHRIIRVKQYESEVVEK